MNLPYLHDPAESYSEVQQKKKTWRNTHTLYFNERGRKKWDGMKSIWWWCEFLSLIDIYYNISNKSSISAYLVIVLLWQNIGRRRRRRRRVRINGSEKSNSQGRAWLSIVSGDSLYLSRKHQPVTDNPNTFA